jgi:hypothetical protein
MTKREKILFALILLFLTTLFFPLIKLANIFAAIFLGLYAFFFLIGKEASQLYGNKNGNC